ncbi:MAG: LptF/LptG family permease, partial [Candidatus Omnitrophica bacterium]|nr:LptF/LptG family permease [Candidatus Omnitrophota bacterium]
KYMVKGFLGPFLWCLFLFTIMAVIIDIFSFIDNIVKFKIPLSSIAAFYIYYSPTIILQVTPMAVLLSTIFVLSNLNKHNEIIAMKSSGISLWRILAPILILGAIISLGVFTINDKIIPISSRVSSVIRRDELEKEKRKTMQSRVIENVAVYGAGNRIIFARNYDTEKKTLGDIIIHEHDKQENLISKITAQSGAWTGGGWKFYKVIMWRIDNAGRILGDPQFFEEKEISLRERPADFANREWRSDYLSYKQLNNYIKNFRGTSAGLVKSLLVDLHYKIAFPLISLIIILIGAPFAIVTTRGGVLIGMGMSIAIGLGYYAFIAISIAFGKAGMLPPIVSAWLGNVVFAAIGIALINKRA